MKLYSIEFHVYIDNIEVLVIAEDEESAIVLATPVIRNYVDGWFGAGELDTRLEAMTWDVILDDVSKPGAMLHGR